MPSCVTGWGAVLSAGAVAATPSGSDRATRALSTAGAASSSSAVASRALAASAVLMAHLRSDGLSDAKEHSK